MRLLLIEGQASHRKLDPWSSFRSHNNQTSRSAGVTRETRGKLLDSPAPRTELHRLVEAVRRKITGTAGIDSEGADATDNGST
ncbi:hypothetical protein EYF80_051404 [Liparis tanakae]|uniref:Uncharacterized protein n=1 Tax=Liparis tanakae TaxID=230148 RepID=A0A4Z2FB91_9TELE|nr:hypothetical protein EYF80_051404 [Liparis tanakae]